MKLRDLKRSRVLNWRDIAEKTGVFASFLMVTVLSLYAWSPAKESSAFDWTSVDGASPYIASLSGNDEIRISATPSASQAVFDQDDVLELTSTCPYGAAIYLNMDSSESNALSREGTDEGIKTISATTGTALNDNSWGYSLDNGSTFLPMPLNTGTPVNIYNSEQVESNTEITVKYGMKIDSSIPSGYYSGNVLYSTVANPSCSRYTLSFNTDGGTEIDDVQLTYGQLIDLSDYETTKEGFDLAGWDLVGTDTTFAADETDANVNPSDALNVTLKAKWTSSVENFFAIEDMQDMTYAVCQTATTPDKTATQLDWDGSHAGDDSYVPRTVLTDTRDGKKYLVSKLADGNCWMSQNLALDLSNTKTLTSEDTDLNGKQSWTPNNNIQTTLPGAWPSDLTVASQDDHAYHPADTDAYYQAGRTKSSTPTDTLDKYLWESAGNYYNWYAATAGEGTDAFVIGDAGDSICPRGWSLPHDSGKMSIRNLITNVYSLTSNATNAATLNADPLNFILAGRYLSSGGASMKSLGTASLYWTSTMHDRYDDSADTVYISTSSFSYSYGKKGYGASIRCVVPEHIITLDNAGDGTTSSRSIKVSRGETTKLPTPSRLHYAFDGWYTQPDGGERVDEVGDDWNSDTTLYARWRGPFSTISEMSTMQEITEDICAASGREEEATLIDIRDNNTYKIAKLKDGKCWMTQNLRIINMTITSDNSDLMEGTTYTIPASDNSSTSFSITTKDTGNAYLSTTYGGYYNYYAATAGTVDSAIGSGDAQSTICPKGWSLPSNEDFGNIIQKYPTATTILNGVPGFVKAGEMYNGSTAGGSAETAGVEGMIWGLSTQSYENGYEFQINKNNIASNRYMSKWLGPSVRCVKNEKRYTVTFNAGNGISPVEKIRVNNGISYRFPTPRYNNHGFLGWYTEPNGGERVTQDRTNWSSNVTLYAHWEDQPSTMQSFTCENINTGDTINLRDTRDNEVYVVRKMKDEKCWMTENLHLGGNTAITLHPSDSDVDSDYEIPSSDITSIVYTDRKGLYVSPIYGGYYNYYTATVGEGDSTVASVILEHSICPKGWRLPTGNSGGEFKALYDSYNDSDEFLDEFGFILQGSIQGNLGKITDLRKNGSFWASSARYTSSADVLAFSTQSVSPAISQDKRFGLSIRCVAR